MHGKVDIQIIIPLLEEFASGNNDWVCVETIGKFHVKCVKLQTSMKGTFAKVGIYEMGGSGTSTEKGNVHL